MNKESIEFNVTPARKAALEKAAAAHDCRSIEGFLNKLLDLHDVECWNMPEQESPFPPNGGFQVRVPRDLRRPPPRRIF